MISLVQISFPLGPSDFICYSLAHISLVFELHLREWHEVVAILGRNRVNQDEEYGTFELFGFLRICKNGKNER